MLNGEQEEIRTEYAYDELNRLKSVNTPIGRQVYYYDKANRITSMLNENTGEETEYLYYPSGAVRNIIIKRGGKEVDRQYYEYDKDGNRTLEMGSGSVKQYTYDEQNRLKRCIIDLNYITDYWYDEFNNITVTRTLSGGAAYLVYYEYDENNRLISSNDGHTTTVYEYDCNGNMVKSSGEETTDYIFNGAGELAEVWQEGEVYTYEYDHTGLRIAKTVDGVTTEMITDGMYVVAEYTGTQNTYYYRGMNLIGYVANDEIGYYRFNTHGDVVAVVDTAGEIVTEYSYDSFGKLEDDENEWLKILFGIYVEDNNPFRYCAEYFDTETEFIYLRARYYSPDLQRFISEDPVRDGNNWYAYCGNNPENAHDPSGEVAITTLIMIGSIVVGVIATSTAAALSYHYTGHINWNDCLLFGVSWGLLAYSLGMSAYGIYLDFCKYYGMTPVEKVEFNTNSAVPTPKEAYETKQSQRVSTGKTYKITATKPADNSQNVKVIKNEVTAYQGIRDPSSDFVYGRKLDSHYERHGKEMGFSDASSYSKAASDFLTKEPTETTMSFVSEQGYYFRYDTQTNEFGIMNQYGGVSTYFKPKTGINYWFDQVSKYANS